MDDYNKQLINELKCNSKTLNNLEYIARRYHNQSIPHSLDKYVLFQLELIHEKISIILSQLYMGDLEEKCFRGELTKEEYIDIIESPFAKYRYMTSTFLYDEKYIKGFSVKDKKFSFNLDNDSCYLKSKGICSLDIYENNLDAILKKEYEEMNYYSYNYNDYIEYAKGNEKSVLYCRSLEESIKQYGFKSPVDVNYYKCKHYECTDGQHRICIASKLNIALPAYVSDMTNEDYSCSYCEDKIKEEDIKEFKNYVKFHKTNKSLIQRLLIKLKNKKDYDYSIDMTELNNSKYFIKTM